MRARAHMCACVFSCVRSLLPAPCWLLLQLTACRLLYGPGSLYLAACSPVDCSLALASYSTHCCLLPAACCLFAIRSLHLVACSLLPVACYLSPVACCLLPAAPDSLSTLYKYSIPEHLPYLSIPPQEIIRQQTSRMASQTTLDEVGRHFRHRLPVAHSIKQTLRNLQYSINLSSAATSIQLPDVF